MMISRDMWMNMCVYSIAGSETGDGNGTSATTSPDKCIMNLFQLSFCGFCLFIVSIFFTRFRFSHPSLTILFGCDCVIGYPERWASRFQGPHSPPLFSLPITHRNTHTHTLYPILIVKFYLSDFCALCRTLIMCMFNL